MATHFAPPFRLSPPSPHYPTRKRVNYALISIMSRVLSTPKRRLGPAHQRHGRSPQLNPPPRSLHLASAFHGNHVTSQLGQSPPPPFTRARARTRRRQHVVTQRPPATDRSPGRARPAHRSMSAGHRAMKRPRRCEPPPPASSGCRPVALSLPTSASDGPSRARSSANDAVRGLPALPPPPRRSDRLQCTASLSDLVPPRPLLSLHYSSRITPYNFAFSCMYSHRRAPSLTR